MSDDSQDVVKAIRDKVVKSIEELQAKHPERKYILVEESKLLTVLGVLRNLSGKVEPGTTKEVLLDMQSALEWVIKNRTVTVKDSNSQSEG
jgi:hypothetical protein